MKLHHLTPIALAMVSLLRQPAAASEIQGVRFAESVTVHDTQLQLRGTGLLRYRVVFRGYVAALYLDEAFPENATTSAVLAETPRRLEIQYFWGIPRGAFAHATVEGIESNTTPQAFQRLRERIDEMNALYEDIAAGDRYTITYVPGHGTELARNGRLLGTVEGAEFSSALFAIWLGDRPLDATLRAQLLAAN
jgi:hypothetical protein